MAKQDGGSALLYTDKFQVALRLVWLGNNSAKVAMLISATFSFSGYYHSGHHVGKILTLAFCHSGIPLHLITREVPFKQPCDSCTVYGSVLSLNEQTWKRAVLWQK